MIYIVIAYRWGWLNEHQYIHHAGLDREAAMDAAESEADNRGGKYGVAVYANDGEHHDLIDYTPSTWGESMPTHNCHTDKFITLGLAACNWVQDGKAWLPTGEGTLNYKPVDPPPQWLVDRVKKEDDMARFMSELREKRDGAHNPQVRKSNRKGKRDGFVDRQARSCRNHGYCRWCCDERRFASKRREPLGEH